MSSEEPQVSVSTIPAHIRESLKAFDEHKNVTCLECGYDGMMGVKAKIVPWYVSEWAIVAVILLFAIFGGGGFVLAIILAFLRMALVRHVVVCPNCKSELNTK